MFLHNYQPQPILVKLGPISIYWYGMLIVAGFCLGAYVAFKLAKKYDFRTESLWSLAFYVLIFGLIASRLYHVGCELPYYLKNPVQILKIWQGGLAIWGAIIGAVLVFFFYARRYRRSYLALWDIVVPGLALGQAIGRWGNWFNQELFGRPVAWGIPIKLANRPEIYQNFTHFHPVFLYESIWCFLIFLILMLAHKKIGAPSSDYSRGRIFALYLILYSLGRFFIELIRIDPQPIFFGLRAGQLMSIVLFVAGWTIFIRTLEH